MSARRFPPRGYHMLGIWSMVGPCLTVTRDRPIDLDYALRSIGAARTLRKTGKAILRDVVRAAFGCDTEWRAPENARSSKVVKFAGVKVGRAVYTMPEFR